MQGWAPVELNERGRKQSRELGSVLAATYEFDHVLASDLLRARETAALLREAGVEPAPRFERDWRERDVGVYQGFTREELSGRFPAFTVASGAVALDVHPEGGERLRDVCERVTLAWRRLCDRARGGTALVVTHGGPILIVLAVVTGTDIITTIENNSVSNCTITEVCPEAGVVHRQNTQPTDLHEGD